MKNFTARILSAAACLAAFALPASAEPVRFWGSTSGAGPLGQAWTGSWADGWDKYEWISEISIDGNVLSYDYVSGGAPYGTPSQTYVFSTTAAHAGILNLGIDFDSNPVWDGLSTSLYLWQGDTATLTLLSNGTNGALEHASASLTLAEGEAWGFMAVSGSIDGNNSAYTGPLYGSFTVTGTAGGDGGNDVPEPASLALLGAGLLGVAAARRRKG